MFRRLCIAFLGVVSVFVTAACQQEPPVSLGTGQQALVLAPGPGGVFTDNCEAACNGADTICGTVQDPANPQLTCCCIGGCPGWGPTCAAGVADGSIGPGESPVGGGVFTASCEQACNASDTICGTVANAAGQTCCCIGGCPDWGPTCAAGVADGSIGVGESPVEGGVFTASCEQACNASNTTCGTVANAAGQTCCCVGTCPEWGPACTAGVTAGTIGPGTVILAGDIVLDIAGPVGPAAAPARGLAEPQRH